MFEFMELIDDLIIYLCNQQIQKLIDTNICYIAKPSDLYYISIIFPIIYLNTNNSLQKSLNAYIRIFCFFFPCICLFIFIHSSYSIVLMLI